MTSKLSWIFFIPLTIAAIGLKIYSAIYFAADDAATLFGLSRLAVDYIVFGCIAVIFIFALIFCLADRKISSYYLARRNIPSGIAAILLALCFAADGASGLFNMLSDSSFEVLTIIETVLILLSAIAFIVLGLTAFTKNSDPKRFAVFYLMPALFCSVRLVKSFISITTISLTLADVGIILCYVFSALFLFNYAVMRSLIETKRAVKYCFIYGFPAVAALLVYSVNYLCFSFSFDTILDSLFVLELCLLAVYILIFLIELTKKVRTRDSVEIVEGKSAEETEDEINGENTGLTAEKIRQYEEDNDTILTTDDITDEDEPADPKNSLYLITADPSDYIYQETLPSEVVDKDLLDQKHNADDIEGYIVDKQMEYDTETDEENKPSEDSMDEIDKLIIDLSSEY